MELLPGADGTPIIGRLIFQSLNHKFEDYEALSYMWGSTTETKAIHLNQKTDFEVTKNLEAALHALRLPDKPRILWIDAICINQRDIRERNQQVQLMRKIYRCARTVIAWIDIEVDSSSPAFRKLLTLNEQSIEEDLGRDYLFWDPLSKVFQNSYWMRVWVQQEISNARSLVIQCRKTALPIFNLFHYLRITSARVAGVDINTPEWINWLDVRPNMQIPTRFSLTDSSSAPIQGSTLGGMELSLLETLAECYKLQCNDDRDRLYGILYLSCDYVEGDTAIDCALSVEDVYVTIPDFVLRKYSSLNFLLYAGLDWKNPGKEKALPTWTGGNLQSEVGFLPIPGNLLRVYGMKIDTICCLFSMPEGVKLYETLVSTFLDICRRIIKESLSKASDVAQGEKEMDEFSATKWYSLVSALTGVDNFKPGDPEAYQKLKRGFAKSADNLIKTAQSAEAEEGKQMLRVIDVMNTNTSGETDGGQIFLRLAWGFIGKHLPFVGARGGIGAALQSAGEGDEVWMLLGCDKPTVLRPKGEHYLVVGEGYYEGANRGELLRGVPETVREEDVIASYKVESISLR